MTLCSKIDTCPKIDILRDKDMLDFQFADAVKSVCGKCNEFTTGEQDELSLTNGEVVPILKKYHSGGIFDFMGFTQEILAKAKQHIIDSLENDFKLAPYDDSYLRLLIRDSLDYFKTGKSSKERADERYEAYRKTEEAG